MIERNRNPAGKLFNLLFGLSEMCGVAPTNVDDCGEFGNPECPCFGIGIEEYEARFGRQEKGHDQ